MRYLNEMALKFWQTWQILWSLLKWEANLFILYLNDALKNTLRPVLACESRLSSMLPSCQTHTNTTFIFERGICSGIVKLIFTPIFLPVRARWHLFDRYCLYQSVWTWHQPVASWPPCCPCVSHGWQAPCIVSHANPESCFSAVGSRSVYSYHLGGKKKRQTGWMMESLFIYL